MIRVSAQSQRSPQAESRIGLGRCCLALATELDTTACLEFLPGEVYLVIDTPCLDALPRGDGR